MKRIGDDSAGFTAEYDAVVGAVRVRGWGFWSATVSEAFFTTVADVYSASPRGAALHMDMTELKPLRDEGQKAFGRLMGQLGDLGVPRATVATASHLTRLQLLRLVTESRTRNTVEFTTMNANGSRDVVGQGTPKERMAR